MITGFCCVGILGSMFSFLQYLTSPVIGAVSDVYGRRPLMILTSVSFQHVELCLVNISAQFWCILGYFQPSFLYLFHLHIVHLLVVILISVL